MVIIVALIWSLTPVLDKECMKYTDIYLHGFIQSLGMLLFFPLIFIKQITLKSLSLHKKIRVNFFILALVAVYPLAGMFGIETVIPVTTEGFSFLGLFEIGGGTTLETVKGLYKFDEIFQWATIIIEFYFGGQLAKPN